MASQAHFPDRIRTGGLRLPLGSSSFPLTLFLAAAACFLYVGADAVPIALWDESRNIVNALEMRASGDWLVTSYGFEPDLWNTKPPLLIWLMTGSMALFGATEWALRLPSIIAALGTLSLVLLLVRRATESSALALGAAAILLLSPGFLGKHGAGSADYDTLLTFFTTLYGCLLFRALSSSRPKLQAMALAGLAIAAAVMTKSAAGLVPGAGIALYLLWTGRLTRLWNGRGLTVLIVASVLPVLLFLIAREAEAPGYLAAILHNDTLGRATQTLIGREEPATFYLQVLASGWFFAGAALPMALVGVVGLRGKSRALVRFSLAVAGGTLIVLSFAGTKLGHYALPACPWLAIAMAVSLRGIWRLAGTHLQAGWVRAVIAIAAAFLFVTSARWTVEWRLQPAEVRGEQAYGTLFAALARAGESEVSVREPGFVLEGRHGYAPVFRAYQLLWAEQGLAVQRGGIGRVVASCDPREVQALRGSRRIFLEIEGCVAVRTA